MGSEEMTLDDDGNLEAVNPVVERERRLARPAALAAFAALACYFVSVLIEQGTGVKNDGPENIQLISFDKHSGTLLLASIIRSLGFLALTFPLYYLFRAAQARSDRVRPELVAFAFIGPVILAVQGIVAWMGTRAISNDFLNNSTGGDPVKVAKDLIENDSTRKIASALLIPAVLALMVAMIYIPLQSYRVGLITRFAGTLGMALGASMFLIFPIALLAIMCWIVFLGLIFINKVPGGRRPPAWDAGRAIPWEVPERGQGRGGLFGGGARGPAKGDETVEGTGSEKNGAPSGNAPRQRGERRKRKRRQ